MPTTVQFQFLDVGMGDGTLVIMGEGADTELALIDFGVQPFTKFKIGADDALTYLTETIANISNDRNLDDPYLDHLFITHPDQDHYNRIMTLVDADFSEYQGRYDGMRLLIGNVTFGGQEGDYGGDLIDELRAVTENDIEELGDQAHADVNMDGSVDPDWQFVNDTVKVYLLSANYPSADAGEPNPKSVCLMFEDDSGNKMIFMGDAEESVEDQIIGTFRDSGDFLDAYGLKLGHHGSQAGTSQAWLDEVNPAAIFASGDFVWAHPYCNTIERVIDHDSLGEQDTEHRYCCGRSGGEYTNNETQRQIFLNLWYVVKSDQMAVDDDDEPPGEYMVDEEDGSEQWAEDGTTYGVQWEMEFDGQDTPTFAHTDTSNPRD